MILDRYKRVIDERPIVMIELLKDRIIIYVQSTLVKYVNPCYDYFKNTSLVFIIDGTNDEVSDLESRAYKYYHY